MREFQSEGALLIKSASLRDSIEKCKVTLCFLVFRAFFVRTLSRHNFWSALSKEWFAGDLEFDVHYNTSETECSIVHRGRFAGIDFHRLRAGGRANLPSAKRDDSAIGGCRPAVWSPRY